MTDFQLLEAEAAKVSVTTLWRREPVWMHPKIKIGVEARRASESDLGHLTAIIGQNGTGKTHLLTAIIESLLAVEAIASGRRSRVRQLPLERLAYQLNGRRCELRRRENGDAAAFIDGREVHISNLPLPSRIVALTITPFDKFPVPRMQTYSVQATEGSRYRYLGLRDRTGKASIENLLFRSLNSLFESTSNPAVRRVRINHVFEFLKLKPQLTVVYRARISREVLRACRAGEPILNDKVIGDRSQLRRSLEVVKSGQASEEQLRRTILHAAEVLDRTFIRLTADFGNSDQVDPAFAQFQTIRRAGFLQLRAVEVEQEGGLVTDLKRASSGQISIATALLSLASEIQDGSLVLIDEPELSLHPDWQIRYIDLLLSTFRHYEGCHFLIATHSPLVISELPPHATLVSLDNPDAPAAPDLAGQSADVLLAEAFHLTSNNNLHLRDLIVEALRSAADGEAGTNSFDKQVAHLERLTNRLPEADGVRTVVVGLRQAAAHAKNSGEADAGSHDAG